MGAWHITRISQHGDVYGHETKCCDAAGCAGDEQYLSKVDAEHLQLGNVYEIDDATGAVVAEIE